MVRFLYVAEMRRSLVLTDEARHPFLASLPPRVRRSPQARGLVRLARRSGIGGRELRHFGGAYIASLIAVSLFIF